MEQVKRSVKEQRCRRKRIDRISKRMTCIGSAEKRITTFRRFTKISQISILLIFESTRRTNARNQVNLVPLFFLKHTVLARSNKFLIARLKTLRRHFHYLYSFFLSFIKGVKKFFAFFKQFAKFLRKEFQYSYFSTFPLL